MLLLDILPPEVMTVDEWQLEILNQSKLILGTCVLISVLLILQLFYDFIKPSSPVKDRDLF